MEKIIAIIVAFCISLVITPWVIKKAFIWGAIDKPDPRKVHKKVMPRLGGLSLYLAFVVALFILRPVQMGFLLGITLIVLIGIIDDIRGLSPWSKLASQVIAALSLIPFGLKISFITNPLDGQIINLGWWGVVVTLFWVVAITNAVNLIDGLDGLAGGISLVAALTIATVSWTQWKFLGVSDDQQEVIMLALVLAAAILGFLRYNFYPARIFLGDSGAMFLGFTIAIISVMGLTKSVTAVSVFIPLVILGIPLMDTAFAIVRRYSKQRPIFQADREHMHHQLLTLGISHRKAVLIIYGISVLLGLSAVILNLISTDQAMILLLVMAVLAIVGINRLNALCRVKQKEQQHFFNKM